MEQAGLPFTFELHGYSAVVGPAHGVAVVRPNSCLLPMQGHPLVVPGAPASVSMLSLVRDAVARLPNGVGTRSDVAILLRQSAFLRDSGNDGRNQQVCILPDVFFPFFFFFFPQ